MAIFNNGIGVITPEIRQKIQFLGTNPIATTAEDTVDNWAALGTGVAGYSGDGKVTDKPTTYGILINNVYYDTITQIWQGSGSDGMWYRRGNSNGWAGSWIKVLDEKTGIQIKKLWTNSSPTSDFAAQTISLSLSGYDFVRIVFVLQTEYPDYEVTFDIPVGKRLYCWYSDGTHSNNVPVSLARRAIVNTTGIQFAVGYSKSIDSTTRYENTAIMVPKAIYGIKGVQ